MSCPAALQTTQHSNACCSATGRWATSRARPNLLQSRPAAPTTNAQTCVAQPQTVCGDMRHVCAHDSAGKQEHACYKPQSPTHSFPPPHHHLTCCCGAGCLLYEYEVGAMSLINQQRHTMTVSQRSKLCRQGRTTQHNSGGRPVCLRPVSSGMELRPPARFPATLLTG